MITALLLGATMLWAPRPAEIFPKGTFDFRVFVANAEGDIGVGNDSHLLASAQIRTMGLSSEIVKPHLPDEFQTMTNSDVIGGQRGFFLAYKESTKEFDAPDGRNCWVEILTAGVARSSAYLSPEEMSLHERLLERTTFDNILVPAFLFLIGERKLDMREDVYKALITAFTHNTKILEDIRDFWRGGLSFTDFFEKVMEFWIREIETGGLTKEFIIDGVKSSLARRVQEQALRLGLANIHPALKAAQMVVLFLDKGPDVIQVLKTIYDVTTTPTRMTFKVFFSAELSDVTPTRVSPGPIDQVFVLSGYQMFDTPNDPMSIVFNDKNGKAVHYASPDMVLYKGTEVVVTVPKEVIRTAASPLTVSATFGGKLHTAPQKIRISPQLEAPRLNPVPASVFEPIEVHSPDISRYLLNNKVFFGDKNYENGTEAQIERVAEGYIVATVPNIVPTPPAGGYKVWVERNDGRSKFRSKLADFRLDPEDYAEKLKKRRNNLMPDKAEMVEGVLSPTSPVAEFTEVVAPGTEFKATLVEVTPEGGAEPVVKSFGLDLYVDNAARNASVRTAVATPLKDVKGRQPNAWLSHTPDSRQSGNVYITRLEYGSGGPLKFKVKLERIRRDDCESGHEASSQLSNALPIQTNRIYKGYLFGHELKANEDRLDQYLISNVQAGQKIKLKMLDIRAHAPSQLADCNLSGVFIQRLGEGQAGSIVASHVEPLTNRDAQRSIYYEDARPGDYVISIRHGAGNVEYSFRVEVGFDVGPDPAFQPVKSLFDAGNNDSWKIEMAGSQPRDAHWMGTSGKGWIGPMEMFGNRTGPLDLALVIDCTSSMNSVIQSVKDKSAEIVDRLRVYSPDMRLGITFFADAEAAGGVANAIKTLPIAADPLKQLQQMATWPGMSGGSDEPEDVLLGLRATLDHAWRAGSVGRAILVFTDNPAKLANGRDAQGNTMASITALARSKGVQIIPVPVNDKPALMNDCAQLASRTGGQVVPFTTAGQIVDLLSDTVGQSIERSLPAYYVAPPKFLGDMSRFYGMSLSYKISCRDYRDSFNADDIVISNGTTTLSLKSAMRPHGASIDRESWAEVTVPLSVVGAWRVKGTNQLATKDQMLDVLANLRSFQIRAEYYGGRDSTYLDSVVFGSNQQVTDRGLSDEGEEGARYILDSIDAILKRWETSYGAFEHGGTANDWLYANLRTAGITPENFSLFVGSDLATPLGGSTTRGPRNALRDEMVAKLYLWLDQVRYRGQLSADQRTIIGNGIRDWNERMRTLDADFSELKQACLGFVRSDFAYQKAQAAGSRNLDTLFAEKDRWDKKVYELKNRVAGQFGGVYLPSP